MRKLIYLLPFVLLLAIGCKKDNDPTPPDDNSNALNFISLESSNDTVKISEYATFTATATGDELTYTWTPEYGTIIGSGAVVQWNVCHSDLFTIECVVEDKYGEKQTKTIDIYVEP